MLDDLTQKMNEMGFIGKMFNVILPQAYMATSVKDLKYELPKEIKRRYDEGNPVKTMNQLGKKFCIVMTEGAYNLEALPGIEFYNPSTFTIERATMTDLANNLRIFYTTDGPLPKLNRAEIGEPDDERARIYAPIFWYEVNKNRLFLTKYKDDMPRPRSPSSSAKKSLSPLETVLAGI